ncbi:alpha/beta fold hydrolase [Rudaeicoccus suwonensis]|uniref:Pimeloyl-ACP methyl ester carboxylesterase n=1 Tax=Rudaeicoccus suwonensis TaxID=657409 RepID=A0A561E3H7_9MICO|nr:alpha/beta hydrolase [Rudaeicoccus suwonensis]TWE10150.1 pimeloyl-ACP methyl ester carboxylesterase [Rudaeicoccus suwonensis]
MSLDQTTQPRDRYIDIDGVRVRYVLDAGPGQGPTFLLVHGLGGSLENWGDVIPLLAQRGRVVALDLGGHGLTQVEPRKAVVSANLTLLQRFAHVVCDGPVVVVGNSMGGLLAGQLAALDKRLVAGAVLVDPVIPLSPGALPEPLVAVGFGIYATPRLGPWFMADRAAKVPVEVMARQVLSLVASDIHRVSDRLLEAHIESARRRRELVPDGDAAFLSAAKSVLLATARRGDYARRMDTILAPVLLLHGDRDRLVSVKAARSLAARHPHWRYVEGAGIGHTPMLDWPDWTSEQILAWIDATPSLSRLTPGVS